jgi:hypothetical protein
VFSDIRDFTSRLESETEDYEEKGTIKIGRTDYIDIFNTLIRGCIQKFQDWPPGARTANGTAFCH